MPELSKKDFESNQDPRWCPGCGDYAVLATVQKTLPKLNIAKENIVFVSGIGCASRFPYYIDTYGLHTLHGRATAYATGIKIANPALSVFIAAGDGDLLSIGLSHFIHLIRRNLDVTVLLFNNSVYGLTKGQYSPTSEKGVLNKTAMNGVAELAINPVLTALSAGCGFVGRCIDTESKSLSDIIIAAHNFKGTAVIEILQNCNIFNDKVYDKYTNKKVRDENCIYLKHNEKLLYGIDKDKAIINEGLKLITSSVVEQGMVFDKSNFELAMQLAQFNYPNMPVPLGVIYANS